MIERLLPLSEVLQNHIWGEDAGFVNMYPEEGRNMLKLDRLIAECLRVSREEFSDRFVPTLEELAERHPDNVEYSLDSMYVRELIDAVPGMVKRTLQLTGISATRDPSKVVNEYLREAVRAYIFGFPQASIALSRAVIEQAVKECANEKPDDADLTAWIEQVAEERSMDRALVELAKSVARMGNRVLHAKLASLPDAFETLANARRYLTELYS